MILDMIWTFWIMDALRKAAWLDVLRRLNSKPFLAVLFSYNLYCKFWLNMYLFAKPKLIIVKMQKINLS